MNNVAFCIMFPVLNGKMSGALLVAYKMARFCIINGYSVKIVDYKEGLLYKLLLKDNLDFHFIDLSLCSWSYKVDGCDVVLGFNNDVYCYPYYFVNNPNVLIYDVYPPFWKRFLRPKGIGILFDDLFVRKIASKGFFKNALAVMETVSVKNITCRYPFVAASEISIVPVSLDVDNINSFSYVVNDALRITYIGRSEVWKMTPLVRLLKDALELSESFNIIFNVVVSNVADAKSIISDFSVNVEDFNINFYENLDSESLDYFIRNNTDVGFAMGTSALEFASRGIPTILADFSLYEISSNYKYKWIFDSDGLTLGLDLDDNENSLRFEQGYDLECMLHRFYQDPKSISQECWEYVLKNHSICSNYSELVYLASRSSFKVKYFRSPLTFLFYCFQSFRKIVFGRKLYER